MSVASPVKTGKDSPSVLSSLWQTHGEVKKSWNSSGSRSCASALLGKILTEFWPSLAIPPHIILRFCHGFLHLGRDHHQYLSYYSLLEPALTKVGRYDTDLLISSWKMPLLLCRALGSLLSFIRHGALCTQKLFKPRHGRFLMRTSLAWGQHIRDQAKALSHLGRQSGMFRMAKTRGRKAVQEFSCVPNVRPRPGSPPPKKKKHNKNSYHQS